MRILHLEDNFSDVEMIQAALRLDGTKVDIKVVSNAVAFREALNSSYDVVLSDSSIKDLTGRDALRLSREHWPGVPFIFVSGRDRKSQPEYAAASGWISKSELSLLPDAIRNATARRQPAAPGAPMTEWYAAAVERLVAVVQELSVARNLETIMEIVRHAARELTGADGATFVLRDGDLCHYADEEAIAPLWKGKKFPMSSCISGWAMLNGQAAIIEDIYADSRIPADAYRPTFVKSLAMVPIRTNAPVGAIGNYWASRRQPRAEEVRLLQALADSTSIAMENVQLYDGLERKVAERTADLHIANHELEAFSYSVSHDLRAPVRHIAAFAQMLRPEADERLSADGQRFLTVISDAALRMGQMIDDLLQFSRMSRAQLANDVVGMNQLVTEVIQQVQADVAGREIAWDINDLSTVRGDRSMLKHVWENLISNAIKYTGKQARAEIKIGVKSLEGELEFFISDNGAGFDMKYAKNLFGVFQRLHTADEFEGTGIGLANVHRIITRHGGTVRAEAKVGQGATFFFTLPATFETAAAST